MEKNEIYEFGPFRLDSRERLFLCEGRPVSLSPQLFDLLALLVQNSGHLLTKEFLRNNLWGENYYGAEDTLKVIIGNLRKVLGDGRNGERFIETVTRSGYRFVAEVRKAEVSAEAPANCFPEEKTIAGLALEPPGPETAPIQGRSYRLRLLLGVASGLALLILAASVFYHRSQPHPQDDTKTAVRGDTHGRRRVIALLPFKDLSANPEDGWLSTAFPEWLISEVGAGGQMRVVPADEVARLRGDMALPVESDYSAATVARIGQGLRVDLVLLGSFADSGESDRRRIRLDMKVIDPSTGQLVTSLTETGDRTELFDFVDHAGNALREKLGLLELQQRNIPALRATLPANQKAARLYIEGVEKFRQLAPLAARPLLEQAVAADPEYPAAHAALSAVWSALGYELNARAESDKALELSSGLPREQYLEIEATCREANKDWIRAVQIYQTLTMFAPDNIDYALRLARAQINSGQGQEALATLRSLRASHPESHDNPRVDYLEAKAEESLGNFPKEMAAAEQAITKARAVNARQLIAHSLLAKSWALDNSGRTKEAADAGREAKEIYSSIGDRSGIGWALKNIADAAGDGGNHAEAVAGYKQALEYFRQAGNEHGVMIALTNMGFDLKDSGDLEGAKAAFGEAISTCERTGDTRAETLSMNGLGTIFWREGNLAAARKMYESALAEFRVNHNQTNEAKMLRNIALVLEDQGELKKAQRRFEEAIALNRQTDSKSEIAANLENLGELLLRKGDVPTARRRCEEAEKIMRETEDNRTAGYAAVGMARVLHVSGDMPAARSKYDQAMKLRTGAGEKGLVAETALLLAGLELNDLRLPRAESLARQAVQEFTSEKRSDQQASALAMLARVHLQQGNLSAARQEIRSAIEISGNSQDPGTRMDVDFVSAQIDFVTGNAQAAARKLRDLLHACRKFGDLGMALEIRLALARRELKTNRASGLIALTDLTREARQRGFLLIAAQAADAAETRRVAAR